eukprot:TRINITY_DN9338_c0_g1_i1.p1 TRINITY_DN9338_c0_g1~~TRINITY_DN9338_c0_g1_i1.p1  ORF type:complete len:181 (-),score=48.11 TRINITY_DN9338_c0_g1_i1:93-635(-)
MLTDSDYNPLSQQNLTDVKKDPIHFLEFLIVAMIESLKEFCNSSHKGSIVMEAADSSECLEKFLKFPTPDRVEVLIKMAMNFKEKLTAPKSEDAKARKIVEVQAKSVAMNPGWITNSIPTVKASKEKLNGTGEKLSDEKLKIVNDIQTCIEAIENERKHYNADNIDKCIKMLKEITEEIK